MICPKCGAQLPDDSVFCATCGANLSETPAPEVQNVPVQNVNTEPAPAALLEVNTEKTSAQY